MDVFELVQRIMDEEIGAVANNRIAQFGPPAQPLLGAELLPEREVPQNEFTEDEIIFTTVIGNASTRYGPAQLKNAGGGFASMRIKLFEDDLARIFTARDYDAMLTLLGNNADEEAMIRVINWVDIALVRGMTTLNEKYRWEVLVEGVMHRVGDNNLVEDVYYPTPTGSRVTIGDDWTDPTVDPYINISAGVQYLRDKGYNGFRMITGSQVATTIARNPNIIGRAGSGTVAVGAGLTLTPYAPAQANRAAVNGMFAAEFGAAIETYDNFYRTQTGTQFYLPRDVMVIIGDTGRQERIPAAVASETEDMLLQNTLGYTGIGRPAGQPNPGRAAYLEPKRGKAPHINGEIWQTAAPVLLDPEAIYVIDGITT